MFCNEESDLLLKRQLTSLPADERGWIERYQKLRIEKVKMSEGGGVDPLCLPI